VLLLLASPQLVSPNDVDGWLWQGGQDSGRALPGGDWQQLYRFVHIAKTAGTSFLRDARQHLSNRTALVGAEDCYKNIRSGNNVYFEKLGLGPGTTREGATPVHMSAFLRFPRAHVLSLFLECKYDRWGKTLTKQRGPFAANSYASDMAAFGAWMLYFTSPSWSPREAHGDFDCYNPWNMQSRHFVCSGSYPYLAHHALVGTKPTPLVPPMDEVQHSFDRMEWVGITELYHESLCVFHYGMFAALPLGCDCAASSATQNHKRDTHETHHVPKHDVAEYPADLLALIDTVTVRDHQLYIRGVGRFIDRARSVERATRIRIICPAKLAKVDALVEVSKRAVSAAIARGAAAA